MHHIVNTFRNIEEYNYVQIKLFKLNQLFVSLSSPYKITLNYYNIIIIISYEVAKL